MMTIYDSDIEQINILEQSSTGEQPPPIQCLGVHLFVTPIASKMVHVVRVHVSLFDDNSEPLTSRDPIEAFLVPGMASRATPRLDGPWLRHKLYTTSEPNAQIRHRFTTVKSEIANIWKEGVQGQHLTFPSPWWLPPDSELAPTAPLPQRANWPLPKDFPRNSKSKGGGRRD